ncbi:MAG: hypothetical protein Q8Q00_10210, partial [Dehalococcoidia bacterium]|nr:hypothetical protein [Dehalococcoidia bacterium]
MDPLLIVIAATVTLAVFSFVVGIRASRRSAMEERLEAFKSERQAGPVPDAEGPVLRKRSYSGLPIFSVFLAQLRGSEQAAINLERAGLPLRVGEYYIIRYAMALLFLLIPFAFSRGVFAFIFAAGLTVLGYALPAMWVGSKRASRSKKMNGQLVEALGMVANSLKSGYGLMQSFE